MTNKSIQITLSGNSKANDDRFVHLSIPEESGMDTTATLYDLAQMIGRARIGQSAHTYKKNNCPADIVGTMLSLRVPFYAWPSDPALEYALQQNVGVISGPRIEHLYTEFTVTFELDDTVQLDFALTNMTYIWQTPCYTSDGMQVPGVEIKADGHSTLRASEKIFGVARVIGHKVRHQYTLTKSINLEGYFAADLEFSIIAKWLSVDGKEESETLRLTTPQCVKDLLMTCGGSILMFGGGSLSVCDLSDNPGQLTVYVSGCTGKVISERLTKEDPDSWCGHE